MAEKNIIEELARMTGGKIEEVGILPDDSGFAIMSMPLPKNHWLYETDEYGGSGDPPMPMKMGIGPERDKMAKMIREAAKYAIRASTMCGKEIDFDPDAMIQNFIVGMLGYWTEDGLSHI